MYRYADISIKKSIGCKISVLPKYSHKTVDSRPKNDHNIDDGYDIFYRNLIPNLSTN